MELRKNSFQTTLYKYFWVTNNLPNNLCPYFWKTVVMYLFILPYAIISLPAYVFGILMKDPVSHKDEVPTIGIAIIGLLGYLAVGIIISMGAIFFPDASDLVIAFGIIGWGATIIAGMTLLAKYRHAYIEDQKYEGTYKPSQASILVEYSKAKYNKYCPKITWH